MDHQAVTRKLVQLEGGRPVNVAARGSPVGFPNARRSACRDISAQRPYLGNRDCLQQVDRFLGRKPKKLKR